jgi:hypothetical protein
METWGPFLAEGLNRYRERFSPSTLIETLEFGGEEARYELHR